MNGPKTSRTLRTKKLFREIYLFLFNDLLVICRQIPGWVQNSGSTWHTSLVLLPQVYPACDAVTPSCPWGTRRASWPDLYISLQQSPCLWAQLTFHGCHSSLQLKFHVQQELNRSQGRSASRVTMHPAVSAGWQWVILAGGLILETCLPVKKWFLAHRCQKNSTDLASEKSKKAD